MEKRKEISDLERFGKQLTDQLGGMVSDVGRKHLLPSCLCVMMTVKLGLQDEVIFVPFEITKQDQSPPAPFVEMNKLGRIHYLKDITVAGFIEEVVKYYPGEAFILDQKTAIALSGDKDRPVTLIDYGDNHCLLTGLNTEGINVYFAHSIDTIIRGLDGVSIVISRP